jgi:hypothetical protein
MHSLARKAREGTEQRGAEKKKGGGGGERESIGEKRVEEKEKAVRTQRRTRATKTESQSERNQ